MPMSTIARFRSDMISNQISCGTNWTPKLECTTVTLIALIFHP